MPEQLNLRANQKIFVSRDDKDWYISSVQEVNEKDFLIAMPYQRSQPLILNRGNEVFIRFSGEDAAYAFKTKMTGSVDDKIPLYVLAKPEKVERVQQRNFVRFPISVPVKYAIIRDNSRKLEYVDAYSIDISGGGIKLALNQPYRPGVNMIIAFQLNSDETPLNFELKGTVVRLEVKELKDNRRIFYTGIKFSNISRREQDSIVAYIFSRMAKQKQLR